MPKFSANLTMLFNEVDFLDRFARAAGAGFKTVEFLFPYPFAKEVLKEKLRENNLALILHNLPAGDWAKGERGIACLPGREGEFQEGVKKAMDYAGTLGCSQINCLVGLTPAGVAADKVRETLLNNLRFAAEELDREGIRFLIEPLNIYDMPGFHLTGVAQARELMEAVNHPNIWLQYDVYHMQIMEGNLINTIRNNLKIISHIQIADNPGRNEPQTGEINFFKLFRSLDEMGYDRWVGCEYKPASTTEAGLHWLSDLGVEL